MTNKKSIRKLLIVSLILLAIVPLILLGGVLSWQNFIVQQNQLKDLKSRLSKLAITEISYHIHEQEVLLISVLNAYDLLNLNRDQQQLILSKTLYSSRDREHRNIFSVLTLLDGRGKELASVSRTIPREEYDLRDRSQAEEFVIPYGTGEIYYSPVYFNEHTGEPFIKLSIPIFDLQTMNVTGALVAEIRLRFIWDVIADIRVGETGAAYMLDQNGRVIAHPNPSIVLKGTFFKAPEQSGITTGLKGTRAVLAIEPMHLGSQLFYIVAELPAAEAFRYTARSLLTIIVFSLLTLFCAAALGFVLIRKIVRPIESLAHTATGIAGGDFSRKADTLRHDETGILADTFNIMTSRLVDTIHSLEQKNTLMNSMLNALTHPFYVIDANDYSVKMANPAARFGELTKESTCYALTHHRDAPCDGAEHPCVIKKIKETRKPAVVEHIHYDSDGTPLISEVHGYPIFDKEGTISEVIEYNFDVTARRRDEEKIKTSLKEKEVLLREIHHRVKNNMQIISSLLNLQSNLAIDRKDIEMLKDSQNRIRSMALTHEKLYKSKDLSHIDMHDYINDLTQYILQFYGNITNRVTSSVQAENVWLGLDTAIPCGLIINELVSNSLKHAFPENRKGTLTVTLRKTNEDELFLSVRDNGTGMPEHIDFKNTKSLGLRLVNTLLEDQLRGKIELRKEEGTEFILRFKEIKYEQRF